MHFCFVSTRRGSYFMTELLSAISAATAAVGHTVELAFDRFPTLGHACVYVVIPHEFHAWGDPAGLPDARQRARTIALSTENPGTEWFEATYQLIPQFAAAASINRSSATELQRRGISCKHLQLGYSPLWDTWQGDWTVERPIDVLYLGAADPRRDPLLGGLGRDLCGRRCEFLVPPLEPRTRPRPDFLTGADKYCRLRSAKILLNLHRTTSSALEWMRFLESICNGCVVVSEPCVDNEPLIPDQHFLTARVDHIAGVINQLLDAPERLLQLRGRAYDFVREQLPMDTTGEQLGQLALELPRRPPADHAEPFTLEAPIAPSAPAELSPEAQLSGRAQPGRGAPAPYGEQRHATNASVRDRLRSVSRRAFRPRSSGGRLLTQTDAYAGGRPRVTVMSVLACAREAEWVGALGSVTESLYAELELLVIDRASGNRAAPALRRFLDENAKLPAAVLRQTVDGSVAQARNTLAENARGEYLFILDARGGIYPSTLGRLVGELDGDPDATFSYPMIAAFESGRPVELLSSLPWEPARLKRGNWIDAMVLLRRERLLELGGYCTDRRLAGWEDFHLWCMCAEVGGYAKHVPQVLGWHRLDASSIERGTPAMWDLMRARFPALLVAHGDA